MIRVVIVDDHPMVRVGLELLLDAASDIEVVGSVADGHSAVEVVQASEPDVVLMDLSLPGLDGVAATKRILELRPAAKVLVVSSFIDAVRVQEALDGGAVGYLLKDAEADELVRGVRAAAAGDAPLSPPVARVLLGGPPVVTRGPTALTAREREVLVLAAQGLLNKQIARQLGIREKTVKAHLTSAYRRLSVTKREHAIAVARELGLLGPRDWS